VESPESIIPIGIKYKDTIFPKDLKNICLFSKKFGYKKSIIYKKSPDAISTHIPELELEIVEQPVYSIGLNP
jgi:hypothetical protein